MKNTSKDSPFSLFQDPGGGCACALFPCGEVGICTPLGGLSRNLIRFVRIFMIFFNLLRFLGRGDWGEGGGCGLGEDRERTGEWDGGEARRIRGNR